MERFEYFNKDVKFTGKHSQYIDALWKQNDIQNSRIKTLYELYGLAAIIGLRKKASCPADNSEGSRNLQTAQLINYRPVLKTIMTTILLLDETSGLSKEERIDRAFRQPSTKEEMDDNVELFNSYVRGGIEYLYDVLVERPADMENDYTDVRLENLMALLEDELLPDC